MWNLGERIQETTHDSVVDAKVALQLYKKYLQFQEEGEQIFEAYGDFKKLSFSLTLYPKTIATPSG